MALSKESDAIFHSLLLQGIMRNFSLVIVFPQGAIQSQTLSEIRELGCFVLPVVLLHSPYFAIGIDH